MVPFLIYFSFTKDFQYTIKLTLIYIEISFWKSNFLL